MNRYQIPAPRAAFAIAALALTAVTTSLAVIVPAHVETDVQAMRARAAGVPTEVAIIPSRIEVIGVRDAEMAAAPAAGTQCKDQTT